MLKPTSVQENWTYIDMHLWTRTGSGNLFPCHFYQWMAKLLINQLQNYYESTKSKLKPEAVQELIHQLSVTPSWQQYLLWVRWLVLAINSTIQL